jgi:hypothetical protein
MIETNTISSQDFPSPPDVEVEAMDTARLINDSIKNIILAAAYIDHYSHPSAPYTLSTYLALHEAIKILASEYICITRRFKRLKWRLLSIPSGMTPQLMRSESEKIHNKILQGCAPNDCFVHTFPVHERLE